MNKAHGPLRAVMTCLQCLALSLCLPAAGAQTDQARTPTTPQVFLLDISGGIGPATTDYIERGLARAEDDSAAAVVLRIDTPGGLDAATRDINHLILGSAIPVIVYVAPQGARAASAGTYILNASHLAAMAPATSAGAATPVALGGSPPNSPSPATAPIPSPGAPGAAPAAETEPDEDASATGSTSERKAINDAVAHLRSLAQLRGRSPEFADDAVRRAATLTAAEALQAGVIEIVADNLQDLLEQADGRIVQLAGSEHRLRTSGARITAIEPDWRSRLLSVITDPGVAYLLLLLGLYGLLLEGYSPGAIVPGVVGAISLLMALYALQVLPVNYVGVALIVLGVGLMAAELAAPSFGALGMGGLVALVTGSIMLFDTDVPGFGVPGHLILGVGFASALAFVGVLYLAVRARSRPLVSGAAAMLGLTAKVIEPSAGGARVHVQGEDWQALSEHPLQPGQQVRVDAIEGLRLRVTPLPEPGPQGEPP